MNIYSPNCKTQGISMPGIENDLRQSQQFPGKTGSIHKFGRGGIYNAMSDMAELHCLQLYLLYHRPRKWCIWIVGTRVVSHCVRRTKIHYENCFINTYFVGFHSIGETRLDSYSQPFSHTWPVILHSPSWHMWCLLQSGWIYVWFHWQKIYRAFYVGSMESDRKFHHNGLKSWNPSSNTFNYIQMQ